MKKSVAVVLVLAVLGIFLLFSRGSITGWQTIDLPPPPPVPGMAADTTTTTTNVSPTVYPVVSTTATDYSSEYADIDIPSGESFSAVIARLDAVEEKLGAVDLLPAWEQRLNTAEAQVSMASNMAARLDAMQSQIDALVVEVNNLKQRPSVEAPFFDQLSTLESSSRKNLILSFVLFFFVLLIVAGMIIMAIVNHKNDIIENKRLLRQYLINYQKAGYRLDTLRMHLRACGWKDIFVDEVVRELPR
ncbi:MAG: hypothetical protein NTW67_04250 [Candidatus Woesearchaeota archaeon]|nr:hypothetical protein [Candidatus Woesearchaeota archaeon]